MRHIRMEFRISPQERQALSKAADQYGLSLSDYIRRKLLQSNPDINDKDIYISPNRDKSNLITISVLYKILYLIKELLSKNGFDLEDATEAEKRSVEYARKERERFGYNVIKADNE